MAALIRTQHLQWIVAVVASFGCMVLGGITMSDSLGDLQRTGRAVAEASVFRSVTALTDTISAERGPSNGAMDPLGNPSDGWVAKLRDARLATDRRLAEARAGFERDPASTPAGALAAVSRRLAAARARVDAVCADAPGARTAAAIGEGIEAMFAVADEAAGLRGEAGLRLLGSVPEVGVEVLLQEEASALREQTGRLGSYAVMKLTGGLGTEASRLAAVRTEDRVRQLWIDLAAVGTVFAADDAVKRALHDVEADYFAGSLPLAKEILAAPAAAGSAADFTRRYVPGLAAPTRLKDSLGLLTLRKIERAHRAALQAALFSGSVTLAVVVALAWLGLACRKRLFIPLIAVREEIRALAVGRLQEPQRLPSRGREVDEMFAGLAILRGALRRKVVLERAQRRLTRKLKVLTETDELTGLVNRRALAARAPLAVEASDRHGQPVSVILADIDHFKTVNDVHGHAEGDAVLRRVGAALKGLAPVEDLVVRYGGEEFLVLAPGLDGAAAAALAERMRLSVAAGLGEGATGAVVTSSFGVATRDPGSGLGWEAVVTRADAALYRAKRLGRNRVCREGKAAAPADDEPAILRA